MRWGPPIAGPPQRQSFGTNVIAAGIEHQLGGTVTLDWRAEGLLVSILVPAKHVATGEERGVSKLEDLSTPAAARGPSAPLSGRRVLIVEDEALIARQIESVLLEQGCVVAGPVAGPEDALAVARSQPLDAAILDVNLAGARSDAVANGLRERAVPFIVLTGYLQSELVAERACRRLPWRSHGCEAVRRGGAREAAGTRGIRVFCDFECSSMKE